MAPVPTVNHNGPAIRALRLKDGMTVVDLAELVGCAQSVISHLEREEKRPSEVMLNKIARALQVPATAITRDRADVETADTQTDEKVTA